MSDLRQAAQQALEALEWAWGGNALTGKEMVAIAALRAALAEPQTTHWEGCEAVHPECRATPRRPLTDEEISAILDDTLEGGSFFDVALAVARAIERAHGIGEQA